MQVLLSSIGTRGDVQPLLALALELRARGHSASLCVAPNFKDWVESFGFACIPIGPDLRKLTSGPAPSLLVKPSEEQAQQLAAYTVRNQFQVLMEGARGHDLIVGANALQIAARSVAEALGIGYAFAAYCPATLPSPDYPPPKPGGHNPQSLPAPANRDLWVKDAESFDHRFGATLNEERARLGLTPVEGVRDHIFTDHPLLAADPVLAPVSPEAGMQIVQTGAWFLPDETALPDEVEAFLAGGDPPVYFGFGSNRAPDGTGRMFVDAARALERRAIVSRGWADVGVDDAEMDCLSIGDINHAELLPRVAAVVHHGGAGTSTAAARAGAPQVVVPEHYDQFYWAHRVQALGVGVSVPTRGQMTADALASALRECLQPEPAARARALANRMEQHGAQRAADWLIDRFG